MKFFFFFFFIIEKEYWYEVEKRKMMMSKCCQISLYARGFKSKSDSKAIKFFFWLTKAIKLL